VQRQRGRGGGRADNPHCDDPGVICHEFIATDDGCHVVHYVDQFAPAKNWTSAALASGPRTIEIVENSQAKDGTAVLVSTASGFAELDLADGRILKQVGGFPGATNACRLPDGTTAMAMANNIVFVGGADTQIRTIPIVAGTGPQTMTRSWMCTCCGERLRSAPPSIHFTEPTCGFAGRLGLFAERV
jgi:hypothetical protein